MYHFDLPRADELIHFPGEADLLCWDDHSDADEIGAQLLECGDLTVEFLYGFRSRQWDAVARRGEAVVSSTWPDADVARNLEELSCLVRADE